MAIHPERVAGRMAEPFLFHISLRVIRFEIILPLGETFTFSWKETDTVAVSFHSLLGRVLGKDRSHGKCESTDLSGAVPIFVPDHVLVDAVSGVHPEFRAVVNASFFPGIDDF